MFSERDKAEVTVTVNYHKTVLLVGMMMAAVCWPADEQRITTWRNTEATLEIATVLAGVETFSLKQTDYLFDGGSLIYIFEDDRHRDIHLILPNPGALVEDVRATKVQPVLLSLSNEFKSYGAVLRKGEEADKLLKLIIKCREDIKVQNSESRQARRVLTDLIATIKSRDPISDDDFVLEAFLFRPAVANQPGTTGSAP